MIINKNWWKAAGIRAIKTVSQTAIATIGTAAVIEAVNWWIVLSAALLAGVLSLLTSLAGLPEVYDVSKDKGHITVKAYDDYDEDGSPIVDKPCAACDLTKYLDGEKADGGEKT